MGISITLQAYTFLSAIVMGVLVGASYDVLRVCRKAVAHGWLALMAEDFLFFTATALLLFGYYLERCGGEIRFYVVVGLLLGWVLYYFTVGSLVMAAAVKVIALVEYLVRIIAVPFIKLGQLLARLLNMAVKPLVSQKNSLKSHVHLWYNEHWHRYITAKGGTRRWHLKKRDLKKKKKKSTHQSMD